MGGVARRAWARNENSIETSIKYNDRFKESDHITLPFIPEEKFVKETVSKYFKK